MSVQELLTPNIYDLNCNSLTVSGDIPTTTQTVSIYQQGVAGNVVASNQTLYYKVKNGICTMWMNEIPVSGTFSFQATTLIIADINNYVVDIPLPATSGNYVSYFVTVTTNASTLQRIARLGVDGSYNAQGGQLYLNLIPSYTVGVSPDYVTTLVTGSNQFTVTFSMLSWCVSYPVA